MSALEEARKGAAIYEHILSVILNPNQEIAGTVHSVSRFKTKFGEVPAILFTPGTVEHTMSDADLARINSERKTPHPKGVTPNLGLLGIGSVLSERLEPVRAGDQLYVKRVADSHSEEYDEDYKVYTVMVDCGDGNGYVPSQNIPMRAIDQGAAAKLAAAMVKGEEPF